MADFTSAGPKNTSLAPSITPIVEEMPPPAPMQGASTAPVPNSLGQSVSALGQTQTLPLGVTPPKGLLSSVPSTSPIIPPTQATPSFQRSLSPAIQSSYVQPAPSSYIPPTVTGGFSPMKQAPFNAPMSLPAPMYGQVLQSQSFAPAPGGFRTLPQASFNAPISMGYPSFNNFPAVPSSSFVPSISRQGSIGMPQPMRYASVGGFAAGGYPQSFGGFGQPMMYRR